MRGLFPCTLLSSAFPEHCGLDKAAPSPPEVSNLQGTLTREGGGTGPWLPSTANQGTSMPLSIDAQKGTDASFYLSTMHPYMMAMQSSCCCVWLSFWAFTLQQNISVRAEKYLSESNYCSTESALSVSGMQTWTEQIGVVCERALCRNSRYFSTSWGNLRAETRVLSER